MWPQDRFQVMGYLSPGREQLFLHQQYVLAKLQRMVEIGRAGDAVRAVSFSSRRIQTGPGQRCGNILRHGAEDQAHPRPLCHAVDLGKAGSRGRVHAAHAAKVDDEKPQRRTGCLSGALAHAGHDLLHGTEEEITLQTQHMDLLPSRSRARTASAERSTPLRS